MLKRLLSTASACMLAAALAGPAQSGGVPEPGEVAQFDLLPGWRTGDGTHMAALHVRLAPGWKTYWRAPGDAGIPPSFDWQGSRNLASVRFHWPVPDVFHVNGMRSIGYAEELVLPIEMTPRGAGDISIRADLQLGVCQDVCMPMNVRLSAELPAAGSPDQRIRAAMSDMPHSARAAGVSAVHCDVEPIDDGLRVRAEIRMPELAANEVAVFEAPDPSIWVSEAEARREGGALWAEADLVPPSSRPFALDRSELRITVLAGGEAVDIIGCKGR